MYVYVFCAKTEENVAFNYWLLGAFAQLRKATNSFAMFLSVCPTA